jgi:alpha-tubulin suppressor-like RCC1 family protein
MSKLIFIFIFLKLSINRQGQIGDGTKTIIRPFPSVVNTSSTLGVLSGKSIIQITAGEKHTCVIANDGNSYCWGSNGYFKKKFN